MHPLSLGQMLSAALVFGVLYYKDTAMRSGHSHSSRGGGGHGPAAGAGDSAKGGEQGEKRIEIKS